MIQVFNRYLYPGGEEASVARIALDLEAAGHQVIRFWRSSEEWKSPTAPAKWKQPFLIWENPAVLDELEALQKKEKADLWILHNVLPVISLGVYRRATRLNVPIFRWLHNYRPISPSGTLTAGKQMLEPDDPYIAWKETWHGSWRGSFLTGWLSLCYALMHRRNGFAAVRAWIAISEELRSIFVRARWPSDKLFTLRHSWHIQPTPIESVDAGHFLFLGRMVETKGVRFILDLWNDPALQNVPLIMAGQGPLAEQFRKQTRPNVHWVGYVDGKEKQNLIATARAVLVPGLWPEPLGMVAYEAYQVKKPILATNLGGIKEIVLDGETGRLLPARDKAAWLEAILALTSDESARMGANGRRWLENNTAPDNWNRQFNRIVARTLGSVALTGGGLSPLIIENGPWLLL